MFFPIHLEITLLQIFIRKEGLPEGDRTNSVQKEPLERQCCTKLLVFVVEDSPNLWAFLSKVQQPETPV